MKATPETAELGTGYASVLLAGNVTIFLLFLVNAVFREAGNPSFALRALWFGNLINIALDPCLIFGWGPFPELGFAGAATIGAIQTHGQLLHWHSKRAPTRMSET